MSHSESGASILEVGIVDGGFEQSLPFTGVD